MISKGGLISVYKQKQPWYLYVPISDLGLWTSFWYDMSIIPSWRMRVDVGCTNSGHQIAHITKFCTVVPRTLRWLTDFWKICASLEYDEISDELLQEDEFDFNSESAFSDYSEVTVKYLSCYEQTNIPVIRRISGKWLQSQAEWDMVSGRGWVVLFPVYAYPCDMLRWHTLIIRSNILLYFQTKGQRNKLLRPAIFREYTELNKNTHCSIIGTQVE
jgi:hypothetical protein